MKGLIRKFHLKTHTLLVTLPGLGFFLNFNPYLINMSKITALKKYLRLISLLVAPSPMARPNHIVAPHTLARQDTTFWSRRGKVLSRQIIWRDKTEFSKNHNSSILRRMKMISM